LKEFVWDIGVSRSILRFAVSLKKKYINKHSRAKLSMMLTEGDSIIVVCPLPYPSVSGKWNTGELIDMGMPLVSWLSTAVWDPV
jgi:hypothetical protein